MEAQGGPARLLTVALIDVDFMRSRNPGIAAEPLLWALGLPVAAQDIEQFGGQHDVAILLAFSLLDADDHSSAIDGGILQLNGFRDA